MLKQIGIWDENKRGKGKGGYIGFVVEGCKRDGINIYRREDMLPIDPLHPLFKQVLDGINNDPDWIN